MRLIRNCWTRRRIICCVIIWIIAIEWHSTPAELQSRFTHTLVYYKNFLLYFRTKFANLLYVFQIFFREKIQDEEGYILFVRKNALQVLIPKYGLEGILYLNNISPSVTFTYNSEDQSQTCGDIVFRAFDPIVVQMSLDRSNVQHEKLFFKLVIPEVSADMEEKYIIYININIKKILSFTLLIY